MNMRREHRVVRIQRRATQEWKFTRTPPGHPSVCDLCRMQNRGKIPTEDLGTKAAGRGIEKRRRVPERGRTPTPAYVARQRRGDRALCRSIAGAQNDVRLVIGSVPCRGAHQVRWPPGLDGSPAQQADVDANKGSVPACVVAKRIDDRLSSDRDYRAPMRIALTDQ
jgi:hypothetical protein